MTNKTTLRIRGMACARCIDVVQTELSQLEMEVLDIQLGSVTVRGPSQPDDMTRIGPALTRQEFSLIEEQQTVHQRAKAFTDMPAKTGIARRNDRGHQK